MASVVVDRPLVTLPMKQAQKKRLGQYASVAENGKWSRSTACPILESPTSNSQPAVLFLAAVMPKLFTGRAEESRAISRGFVR